MKNDKLKKIIAASAAADMAINGMGNAYSNFGYTILPKATNVLIPIPPDHYKKKRSKKKRARKKH